MNSEVKAQAVRYVARDNYILLNSNMPDSIIALNQNNTN